MIKGITKTVVNDVTTETRSVSRHLLDRIVRVRALLDDRKSIDVEMDKLVRELAHLYRNTHPDMSMTMCDDRSALVMFQDNIITPTSMTQLFGLCVLPTCDAGHEGGLKNALLPTRAFVDDLLACRPTNHSRCPDCPEGGQRYWKLKNFGPFIVVARLPTTIRPVSR